FLLIGFGVFAQMIVKRLSESERQMSEMLANVQLCAVMLDEEGAISYVNDFLLKITGYEKEELIGGNWFDIFIPAKLREEIRSVHKDVLSGNLELVGRYESEMLTKSGERRIVAWNNTLFDYSADGHIVGSTSFGEDITERKQAENKLRESEERFRLMMEQSPSVIEFYDIDGLQINVNKAYEQLWGFPASHTVNKFNVLKSKEVEKTGLMDYVQRAYAGHAVVLPEYEFDSSGETEGKGLGRKRWLSTRIYPLKDPNGNVNNIVITHEDITERKKAENKLRESEDRFRGAFETAAHGMGLVSPKGHWLKVNKALCDIVGYSEKELLATDFQTITYPDDLDADLEYVQQLLAGEIKSYQMEKRYIHKQGHLVWILLSVSLVRDNAGNPIHFVSQINDITERKQAEEELRLHSEIIKNMTEGVYLVGLNDVIIRYANPEFEKMFGYAPGEMIGKHASIVNAPTDKDPMERAKEIMAVIHKTGEWHGEVKNIKKDGTPFWCYANVSVFDHPEYGEVLVAVHTDITDHKRAEDDLRESHMRFITVLDSLDALVYVVDMETYEILFVNNYGHDIWGDVVGKTCWKTLQMGQTAPCEFCTNQKLLDENGQPAGVYLWEFQNTVNDQWYQCRDRAIRWTDGRLVRLEIAFNITERKEAEEALRLSEDKFSKAFHSSPDSVAISLVANGRLLDINEGFEEISGYSRDEALGKTTTELNIWQNEGDRDAMIKELEAKGAVKDLEIHTHDKAGDIHDCLLSCEKIVIDAEPCLVSIARDITEQKRKEAELAEYRSQLQSLVSELTIAEERERRNIAGVLHDDVIQKLSLTKMKLGVLRKTLKSDDQIKPLEDIHDYISEMVKNMRSLTFNLCPPLLYDLGLESALRDWLHREVAGKNDIEVDFQAEDQPLELAEDLRIALYRATRELLVNVIKHAQAQKVSVTISNMDDIIKIEVADDGIGFEPAKSGESNRDSAGLGLFTIRERLGHFGGLLEIESQPGKGSRLILTAALTNQG
ncbi:MAG: PAS domain-containing sensor histidine kinase, partial [Planctomycetota bacterium]